MNRSMAPRVRLLLASVGLCLLFVSGASAQSTVDCASLPSKILARSVPYCVIVPASFKADTTRHYPIVYYLHGLGDNQQSLVNFGGWNIYEDLLQKKKVGEMVIVAPMGYRSFYIDARTGKFNYEQFFFKEFLPFVEAKYRAGGSRTQRAVVGISMGGFGALHYAFERPQMFAAVVGIMPALFGSLPDSFGGDSDNRMFRDVFGDAAHPEHFNKVSVFTLAAQQPAGELRRLKIAFNAGASDDYGFYEGVSALDKLLTRRRIPHESRIDPGRHNAQFAMGHFGEALEFVSKAMNAR